MWKCCSACLKIYLVDKDKEGEDKACDEDKEDTEDKEDKEDKEDATFEVVVRLRKGVKKSYQVRASCTIADLKAQIQPDVTASAWQLRRGARSLANDKTLAALGVGVGAKLRVWICPSKAVRAARYQALKL